MQNFDIWVIANLGLGSKFVDQAELIRDPLLEAGYKVAIVDPTEILVLLSSPSPLDPPSIPKLVVAQVKDIPLLMWLETLGSTVVNTAASIAMCDDKSLTHLALTKFGLPSPPTIVAPHRYPGQTLPVEFFSRVARQLGFPLVIKATTGSFGKEVFLAQNEMEMRSIANDISPKRIIFQKYVTSHPYLDLRIQVIGGKVVAGISRVPPPGDFRSNLTLGGSGSLYQPDEDIKDLAIRSTKAVGAFAAGVDIIIDQSNQAFVLEINSNAHLRRMSQITGIDLGRIFAHEIRNLDI